MCIIIGGIKMKKGRRMRKLVRYECEKCKTIWGLNKEFTIHKGKPIFCGYDHNNRKKYRQEGHCHCGVAFDHPYIKLETLQESYGNAWAQNQEGE
tara:strand:- start:804 stop:1088 length:285 start_codon:yes stop_codon:yes gene_type:complete